MMIIRKYIFSILFALLVAFGAICGLAMPVHASTQVIFGGCADPLNKTNNTTEYNTPWSGYAWDATLAHSWGVITTSGKIGNLYVELSAAPGSGTQTYTFTLMYDGSASALTCAITGAATSASDTSHQIDVVAGKVISLRVVSSNSPANAPMAQWSMNFVGTTSNESLICGQTSSINTTNTNYTPISGTCRWSTTTETQNISVCPTSGNIKNFYINMEDSPGSGGDAYRFTLRVNGASKTDPSTGNPLQVTITNSISTGNDTTDSISVSAGDTLDVMFEPLNTPANTIYGAFGFTFLSTVDGESLLLGGSSGNLDTAAAVYHTLITQAFDLAWTSTEANAQNLGQVCVLKNLYILLSGTPYQNSHSADVYDFMLRDNAGNTALTCQVTSDATTAHDTANTATIVAGDNIDLRSTPTSSPTARSAYWGLVCYIAPSFTNSPTTKAFGSVATNSTYYAKGSAPSNPVVDGDCTYTITNNGGSALKINIKGAAFTGGVGWTLTSGAPGENTVRITAYPSGINPASGVVLTTSDQQLIASLAVAATKMWDFKFETGMFTDGTAKTGTITLTGVSP